MCQNNKSNTDTTNNKSNIDIRNYYYSYTNENAHLYDEDDENRSSYTPYFYVSTYEGRHEYNGYTLYGDSDDE